MAIYNLPKSPGQGDTQGGGEKTTRALWSLPLPDTTLVHDLVLLPTRFRLLSSKMQQTEPEGSLNRILLTLFLVTPVLSASRVIGIVVLGELLRGQQSPDSCKTQLKVQAFI